MTVPTGVILYLVPLNSIIEQQARVFSSKMTGVGVLSAGGSATEAVAVTSSDESEEEEGEIGDIEEPRKKRPRAEKEPQGDANFGIEEIEQGNIKIIIAHAESLHTTTGRQIIAHLATNKLILGTIVDEAHKFLHWVNFRPKMGTIVPFLLGKSNKAPVVLLTATLTAAEVKQVTKKWLLKNPLIRL